MVDTAQIWRDAARSLPRPADDSALRLHWDRWRESAEYRTEGELRVFAETVGKDRDAAKLIDAVFGNSPYLSRSLIADHGFARRLIEDGPEAALAAAMAGTADPDTATGTPEPMPAVMKRLRLAKRQAALTIAMADIAGIWPLERVTGALSDLAEAAIRAGCRHLLRAQHRRGRLALPDPEDAEVGSGLFVLGMGKLGAGELNFSSDVDLIVFYDQEVVPTDDSDAVQPLFVRLTRDLIRIIGEQTADGYVFRTDLRLRPDPGSTPVAMSVRAAGQYYRQAGRNWERAAMIKARTVGGDNAAGRAFLDSLRPFIFRRRLDFAAGQDIQSVKRQIDATRRGGNRLAGYDVKLGRGGIREIEFFAQAQQLIWGGRNPDLQVLGTLKALDALVAAGHVRRRTADELRAAYDFHRRVEHRVQMVNDRQTHSLPPDEEGIEAIAIFLGFGSAAAFGDALRGHRGLVESRFAALFEDRTETAETEALAFPPGGDPPETLAALTQLGYQDPARVSAMVRTWLDGRYHGLRPERARQLLAGLAPTVARAFAAMPRPDAALGGFDRLLARLPDGVHLFSLLNAYPETLDLVAEIMGAAPRLAAWVTTRPGLLDSVLTRDFADLQLPDDAAMDAQTVEVARRGLVRLFYARELTAAEMRGELAGEAARAGDLSDLLDGTRRWASDRVFQIGVHMLRGLLSPVEAGRPLSDIADACLGALMPAIAAQFEAVHGHVPGGQVALIAFGKLGSREMTVTSDLDLLFLYDHDPDAIESDGRKPLAPSEYYARLCRRLVGAVAAPTAEGKLYEVDMRLRPSGNSGPIACSRAAFIRYQRHQALTWEHQALTRARLIPLGHGDDDGAGAAPNGLGALFEAEKAALLRRPRDRGQLAGEIAAMRRRIRKEFGDGSSWAVKHRPGGLLDVEFIAQFLQLAHAAETPAILAGDSIAVFEAAGRHGLIGAEDARALADAARLWRNLQGILRLTIGADSAGADTETPARAVMSQIGGGSRAGGGLVFEALVATMDETAARVGDAFQRLIGPGSGSGTGPG